MKNCFVFGEYLSHLPSKTPSNESNRKIISLFYWLLLRTFPTKSHTWQSIFALPSTRLKVTNTQGWAVVAEWRTSLAAKRCTALFPAQYQLCCLQPGPWPHLVTLAPALSSGCAAHNLTLAMRDKRRWGEWWADSGRPPGWAGQAHSATSDHFTLRKLKTSPSGPSIIWAELTLTTAACHHLWGSLTVLGAGCQPRVAVVLWWEPGNCAAELGLAPGAIRSSATVWLSSAPRLELARPAAASSESRPRPASQPGRSPGQRFKFQIQ